MKESMEEMIDSIVEGMKSLNRQAFLVYKPIVDEICSGKTRARTLLKRLAIDEKISETGVSKMKRYRIANGNDIDS